MRRPVQHEEPLPYLPWGYNFYKECAERVRQQHATTGPYWTIKRRFVEVWEAYLKQRLYILELEEVIAEMDEEFKQMQQPTYDISKRCPYCKGTNLTRRVLLKAEHGEATLGFGCSDCGGTWEETYRLVYTRRLSGKAHAK